MGRLARRTRATRPRKTTPARYLLISIEPTPAATPPAETRPGTRSKRRPDLDWIRVLAILSLLAATLTALAPPYLAKLALAHLYHQTGRDQQAIDLYNEVAGKPSTTVPAPVAQLELADLYVATGKQDQAKAIWAKLKESDKDGMAGSIATQKLAGKQ